MKGKYKPIPNTDPDAHGDTQFKKFEVGTNGVPEQKESGVELVTNNSVSPQIHRSKKWNRFIFVIENVKTNGV